MKWRKRGLIFEPSDHFKWVASHAMQPFAESLGDCHRVYFAGRDTKNRSHIGYFDIELGKTSRILRVCESPLVVPGPAGTFDDSGCNTPWVVNHDRKKYLYFTGWSLGVTVPFFLNVGVAVSEDGTHFRKLSEAPILDRNTADPYLTASPSVLYSEGEWKMWYVSGTRWEIANGRPRYCSNVKYATSHDGMHWRRDGLVCVDYHYPSEHVIGRPCVVKDNEVYRMWYSYRGDSYRIGYAESPDGVSWERKDQEVGIDVSPSGWDSEMICYAHVIESEGNLYMLYNGNGFGKTGIGLAVIES